MIFILCLGASTPVAYTDSASDDELHAFAALVGLSKALLHVGPTQRARYYLPQSLRSQARALGAHEVHEE